MTMTLSDREFWLAQVSRIAEAAAVTASILSEEGGRPARSERRLPETIVSLLAALTAGQPLLSWSALAAATGLVLRRFGCAPSVLLHVVAVGQLPVLLEPPPASSFRDWLGKTRSECAAALAHDSVDDATLMRCTAGHPPVVVGGAPGPEGTFVGLVGNVLTVTSQRLTQPTLEAFTTGIALVLEKGLQDPGEFLCNIPVMDDAAMSHVITGFNCTPSLRADTPFRDLVLEQAQIRPDSVAIHDEIDEITYQDLASHAVAVALRLQAAGVGAGDLVALAAARDPWQLAAATGILFAGAAYLPLDPAAPAARLERMLEQATALIARRPTEVPGLMFFPLTELRAASGVGGLRPERGSIERLLGSAPEPGDLAYAIYTSGSTGEPKAAGIEHRSFLNLLAFRSWSCDLRPGVELPQTAPSTFDVSIWQMFAGLTAGATICVVPDDVVKDPVALALQIADHHYEYIELVPSLISVLLDALAADPALRSPVLAGLSGIVSTGEALTPDLARRWTELMPDVELLNAYGPTECTDDITQGTVTADPRGHYCSAGSPVPNAAVYVLDEDLQPVPPLVAGEIYAGGPNVGRGYLGKAALTASAFLPDPFRDVIGARMYRTGDRGRWRPDGTLECLGRIDTQVKIRGRRVELGEIESVLASHPEVADCAVEMLADGERERLAAFATAMPATSPDLADLAAYLKAQLPDYMVPGEYRLLEVLPHNRNGKIDRPALRALAGQWVAADSYVEPSTQLERELCALFSKHLKVVRVGVNDDFFALGGDSIVGIRLIHDARQAGIVLRLRHLFEHATAREIARRATSDQPGPAEQPALSDGPLSYAQRWFFAQGFVDPHHWNQSRLLTAPTRLDPSALAAALRSVLTHHDQLRSCFPETARPRGQVIGPVPDGLLWQAEADDQGLHLSVDGSIGSLESVATRAHASLSLAHGPLLRAVLVDGHRVLLTVHHLIIDQVSWQILVTDLETAYLALTHGQSPEFPARTAQYVRWTQLQAEAPVTDLGPPEMTSLVRAVRTDLSQANLHGDRAVRQIELTETITHQIRELAVLAPGGGILTVLLTALSRAVAARHGNGQLSIELELHGREENEEAADVSRTVGWFAAFGPMTLPVSAGMTTAAVTAALMAARPGITPRAYLTASVAPRPQIGLNFAGSLDQSGDASIFRVETGPGQVRSARGHRALEWEINAGIAAGRLVIALEHVPGRHDPAEVAAFLRAWQDELAAVVQEPARLADLAPLTPTQYAFFDRELPKPAHWNHGMIYTLAGAVPGGVIERAARSLLALHPVLAASFLRTPDGRWQGRLVDARLPVDEFDLTQLLPDEIPGRVEELAETGHLALDLAAGPIARMHIYRCPPGLPDKLLVVAHHLVMDPYSWEVLTGDLAEMLKGTSVAALRTRTTSSSFTWARRLQRLAQDQPERLDAEYWTAQDFSGAQHITDGMDRGIAANMVELTTQMDAEWTERFVHDGHPDPQLVVARLLTHLSRAVESWLPATRENLLIELGGHGREELFDDIELSRTIGWFTTGYPFLLPFSAGRSFAHHADMVARRLKAVPGRGLGFGALRYLCPDQRISRQLRAVPLPQLRFDFEGELRILDAPVGPADEPTVITDVTTEGSGQWRSPDAPMANLLGYNVGLLDGRMEIRAQFAGDVIQKQRINALAAALTSQLSHGGTVQAPDAADGRSRMPDTLIRER